MKYYYFYYYFLFVLFLYKAFAQTCNYLFHVFRKECLGYGFSLPELQICCHRGVLDTKYGSINNDLGWL